MKNRKLALEAPTEKSSWVKDIHEANERVEKLNETNQKLKVVNQKLLERFLIWQANEDMHGVTQSMLDLPVLQLQKKT